MLKLGRKFKEVLLQLKDQLAEEATWEDADDFHKTFPNYILEDKDQTKGEAIVAVTPAGAEEQIKGKMTNDSKISFSVTINTRISYNACINGE